jgi:hypothetical protein
MFLARSTVESFHDFVRGLPPHRSERFASLAHYLHEWLQSGEAPRECVGSFTVYLQTVILVIIEWQRNPELLDYHGEDGAVVRRRVDLVDDTPLIAQRYDWIDSEYFAYFNYLVHHRPPGDGPDHTPL